MPETITTTFFDSENPIDYADQDLEFIIEEVTSGTKEMAFLTHGRHLNCLRRFLSKQVRFIKLNTAYLLPDLELFSTDHRITGAIRWNSLRLRRRSMVLLGFNTINTRF